MKALGSLRAAHSRDPTCIRNPAYRAFTVKNRRKPRGRIYSPPLSLRFSCLQSSFFRISSSFSPAAQPFYGPFPTHGLLLRGEFLVVDQSHRPSALGVPGPFFRCCGLPAVFLQAVCPPAVESAVSALYQISINSLVSSLPSSPGTARVCKRLRRLANTRRPPRFP